MSCIQGIWLNATQPEGTCGGFVDTIAEIPGAGSCLPLLKEMCKQVGNNEFNVYNMYDTCFPNDGKCAQK